MEKKTREERIGATNKNRNGSIMTVVEYNGNRDVKVTFADGYTTKTKWQSFERGEVKNPYDKTIFGKGYLGDGSYKSKHDGTITKQYDTWKSMLERAYSTKLHEKHPSYIGCSVAEEWHNFQTFAKWFDENRYAIDDEIMQLDKDILVKGNKEYSPSTCVFVPQRINKLFVKVDKTRGKQPIGVYHRIETDKFHATVRIEGKSVFLGSFDTQEEAYQVYKKAKEKYIKETAHEYRDKIPTKLFVALMNYKVSIND